MISSQKATCWPLEISWDQEQKPWDDIYVSEREENALGCNCALSNVLGSYNSRFYLTGAILVVSVPGDGSYEVDAGESHHEALETVSLASVRAIRPVPGSRRCVPKRIHLFLYKVKMNSFSSQAHAHVFSDNESKYKKKIASQYITHLPSPACSLKILCTFWHGR